MFQLSHHRLSNPARRIRFGFLGLCCTPVVGTYFYNQGYRLSFLICPIKHWTGIPCPTCGMTRSFMAIVRGDWTEAFSEHLFGPFLFFGFCIIAIHLTLELLTNHKIIAFYVKVIRKRKLQLVSFLLVMSYYALRLYFLSITGELSLAFDHSPIGQWLSSR